MEKKVFDIGKEDYSVLSKKHEEISHIVLTGKATYEQFCQMSCAFDYTQYHFVTIDNLRVEDKIFENGSRCGFEETIAFYVTGDGIKVVPLDKMIL